MFLAACVLLHCSDSTRTYSGRDRQLDVRIPRYEAEAVIDGDLADSVCLGAARVTDWGYEVEVRIPFKSLRYQPRQPQDWRLNVVREVKHSGVEDSWYPARRASATFIGQAGNLVGLSGMHRGLVMDVNPEATGRASGAPAPGGYQYDLGDPQVVGNIRWGVSDHLTLNGTIKPDFW